MRIKRRFTIVDAFIILALTALVYGGIRLSAPQQGVMRADDVRIRYTIELGERYIYSDRTPMQAGFHLGIAVGDTLSDAIRGFEIGVIVGVYTSPYYTDVLDEEHNIYRRVAVEGLEYVYIVVEATAQVTEFSTLIAGAYEVGVGREAAVRAKSFAGEGHIVILEFLD
jgi:hypothetical protein